MFACLLKIQLAAAGVGTFPSFVSLITDAELKKINWEFSVKPSVENRADIVTYYKQAAVEKEHKIPVQYHRNILEKRYRGLNCVATDHRFSRFNSSFTPVSFKPHGFPLTPVNNTHV